MSTHNEGVIISGHANVKGEVLAMGSGASAQKIVNRAGEALPSKDVQELRSRIDDLKAVVSAHQGSLENREDVESSVKSVADELEKEKPNKLTVTSLLTGIASAVKSVTGIATAAEALKAVVIRLL
jgi:hypothetical protein